MPINTLNILIDAKTLLEHGKLHAGRRKMSRIDKSLAVQHAHHAIELVLRAKAEDLGENPYDLPATINVLKRHGVAIPYEREVLELNKARVLTQHYGTVPDERDAYRLVNVAENFMRDFCSGAFSVDYGNISLTQLISNSDIKKTLDVAQEAYKNEKYEDAAIAAHLAIQKAIWIISEKMRGSRSQIWGDIGGGQLDQDVIASLDGIIDQINEELNSISDIALAAPFALDIMSLKKITRVVFYRVGEEIRTQKRARSGSLVTGKVEEPKPIQKEDAEFALELALEYVVWAEQTYGL